MRCYNSYIKHVLSHTVACNRKCVDHSKYVEVCYSRVKVYSDSKENSTKKHFFFTEVGNTLVLRLKGKSMIRYDIFVNCNWVATRWQ